MQCIFSSKKIWGAASLGIFHDWKPWNLKVKNLPWRPRNSRRGCPICCPLRDPSYLVIQWSLPEYYGIFSSKFPINYRVILHKKFYFTNRAAATSGSMSFFAMESPIRRIIMSAPDLNILVKSWNITKWMFIQKNAYWWTVANMSWKQFLYSISNTYYRVFHIPPKW